MTFQKSLALVIPLLLNSFTGYPTPELVNSLVNSSFQISKNKKLPPVPPTPPPKGHRVPGGVRRGDNSSLGFCKETTPVITALTPEDAHGNTISEHPTFWFYIPYTSQEIISAEFSLREGKNEKNGYKISFKVHEKAGIVSISSPAKSKYSLKPDEYYHWYLKIKCQSNQNSTSDSDIVLDGWVQRITSNPTLQPNLITPDLWYDQLNQLAKSRLESPSDSTVNNEWSKLLKSVALEQIAPELVLGSVQFIEIKE
jgi:Domain of Unknown Function (DUF928)